MNMILLNNNEKIQRLRFKTYTVQHPTLFKPSVLTFVQKTHVISP